MKYFGAFHFDETNETLWRGDARVPLTRKAATLLGALIRANGAWLTKTDIMAAVWPDTHVLPDNVKVLVREIRLALQDDPRTPQYIQTQQGRGYGLIAEIRSAPVELARQRSTDAPVFVNRGPELAALSDAFDAARVGRRRLVLVEGAYGMGKTALTDAFLRVAATTDLVRVAWGQCLQRSTEPEPFAPLLDAFDRLVRHEAAVVREALQQKGPAWIAQFPQWALPYPASGTSEAEMTAQFPLVVESLARDLTLILVLEDVQWADPATLLVLDALAQRTINCRLLVVLTRARVSVPGPSAELQALVRTAQQTAFGESIGLGPIEPSHVGRYLDVRFGAGCLTPVADAIHEATGGIPSLMVRLTDGIIARGFVRLGSDGWTRDAAPQAIVSALPSLLQESAPRPLDLEALKDAVQRDSNEWRRA